MQPTALPLAASTTASTPSVVPPIRGNTGVAPQVSRDPSPPEFADVFSEEELVILADKAIPQVTDEEAKLTDPEKSITAEDGEALRLPPAESVDHPDPLPRLQSSETAQLTKDGIAPAREPQVVEFENLEPKLAAVHQTEITVREGRTTLQQGPAAPASPQPVTALPPTPDVQLTGVDAVRPKVIATDPALQNASAVSVRPAFGKPNGAPPPSIASDGIPAPTANRAEPVPPPLVSAPTPAPRPSSATAPQTMPLIISQVTSGMAQEKRDTSSSAPLEPFTLGRSDGPASLQTTTAPQAVQRSELAGHVARQIADVAHHLPARPVEITLSPEELGRVRLSVSTHESGIILNVAAERPETADLLRRHIGQLGDQFESLGYENIAFSFSGGGDAQTNGDQAADNPATAPVAEETDTAPLHVALSTGSSAGVDLRL